MYQVQSSYPGGGSNTSASGGGGNSYFDALLARENQALLAQQQQRSGAAAQVARPAMSRGMNTAGAQGGPSDMSLFTGPTQMEKLQMEQMQMKTQDMRAALAARMNGQPMRMVGGAGIMPGYMPDVNAMNSYQREAYLPKESILAPTQIDPVRAADDDRFNERLAAQRAGAQNTNLQYGGRR